jgi:hypothetical protein
MRNINLVISEERNMFPLALSSVLRISIEKKKCGENMQ